MKISSATLLMVMVCLLGAIATSLLIGSQYIVVQRSQANTEQTRLAGRDLQQLKIMMGQWYVAIDLFFDNGDSYVARNIGTQADAIQNLWQSLANSRESGAANDIGTGTGYITDVAASIEQLALTGPGQKDTWNQGIANVDETAARFVDLFEAANHQNSVDLIAQANRLDNERDQLARYTWASALIYLFSICLAWMWANRQIVKPIRKLDKATRLADIGANEESFLLQQGPIEVRQLGASLGNYVKELATKSNTISEQKNQLEHRLAELERTRTELVKAEKLASVGQLAAGIAHEINNPMAFISSNLTTLGEYVDDFKSCLTIQHDCISSSADEILDLEDKKAALSAWESLDIEYLLSDSSDVLADINTGTQRITRIVSELSEFTNTSHSSEPVDINVLAEKVVRELEQGEERLGAIGLTLDSRSETVCAPERIEHALRAVVVNALEASSDADRPVEISTASSDQAVWFSIVDRGPGIPEENQLKIFDPFYTTKPVGAGLGLSLHFVQSIVDQHNGQIECRSTQEGGTQMKLSLPIIQAA